MELRGGRPRRGIYYGGDDVMSSAGENSEMYVALRSFWYNKKSLGDLPPWAGDFPRKEKINRFGNCSNIHCFILLVTISCGGREEI
jgi:hypothetical protein